MAGTWTIWQMYFQKGNKIRGFSSLHVSFFFWRVPPSLSCSRNQAIAVLHQAVFHQERWFGRWELMIFVGVDFHCSTCEFSPEIVESFNVLDLDEANMANKNADTNFQVFLLPPKKISFSSRTWSFIRNTCSAAAAAWVS